MTLAKILSTFEDEREIVHDGTSFIEKTKEGVSLKGVLQRGRLKLQRERRHRWIRENFSPSMLTYNYCRRLKIGLLAGVIEPVSETVRPSEQIVLDMGSALHEVVQGYFWEIGLLKGTYKCLQCDKLYHDLIAPNTCPQGHKKRSLRYKEIILRNEAYKISGRSDGIIVIDSEEHIMDIKTIQNRLITSQARQICFEDLDKLGPKSDHITQLMFYMWMSKIHNGHLLYIARNTGQIKSFAVPYDFAIIEPYLVEIVSLINTANDLKQGKPVELPVVCGREACPCDTVISRIHIEEVNN